MAIEQKINYQPFQTAGLKALRAPQRAQSQFRTLASFANLDLEKDKQKEREELLQQQYGLGLKQQDILDEDFEKRKKQAAIQNLAEQVGGFFGEIVPIPGGKKLGEKGGAVVGGILNYIFGAQQGGIVPMLPSRGKFFSTANLQIEQKNKLLNQLEEELEKNRSKKSLLGLSNIVKSALETGEDIKGAKAFLKDLNALERLNLFLNIGQDQRGGISQNQGFRNILPDTLEPTLLSKFGRSSDSLGLKTNFNFMPIDSNTNVETQGKNLSSNTSNPRNINGQSILSFITGAN
tara:strand:+ start:1465 stop:2337 length:873 start_codon:yes stop_codon:yes gene_type:complete